MTGYWKLLGGSTVLVAALTLPAMAAPGGLQTASAAAQGAGVSAATLHIERPGATFAAAGPTLTQARVGQTVRITLYVSITNATSPSVARVRLSATNGAKAILTSSGTFSIGRAQMQGFSAGWRWFYNSIRLTRPGRYNVTGAFSMNGAQVTRQVVLTVSR